MKIPFFTSNDSVVKEPPSKLEEIGDGGAVFISDATDEEFEEYEHNETHGWGKWKEIMAIIKR